MIIEIPIWLVYVIVSLSAFSMMLAFVKIRLDYREYKLDIQLSYEKGRDAGLQRAIDVVKDV